MSNSKMSKIQKAQSDNPLVAAALQAVFSILQKTLAKVLFWKFFFFLVSPNFWFSQFVLSSFQTIFIDWIALRHRITITNFDNFGIKS